MPAAPARAYSTCGFHAAHHADPRAGVARGAARPAASSTMAECGPEAQSATGSRQRAAARLDAHAVGELEGDARHHASHDVGIGRHGDAIVHRARPRRPPDPG
jgi:hypothetical protein